MMYGETIVRSTYFLVNVIQATRTYVDVPGLFYI